MAIAGLAELNGSVRLDVLHIPFPFSFASHLQYTYTLTASSITTRSSAHLTGLWGSDHDL